MNKMEIVCMCVCAHMCIFEIYYIFVTSTDGEHFQLLQLISLH